MTRLASVIFVIVVVAGRGVSGWAQPAAAPALDIEVPAVVLDDDPDRAAPASDPQLDLANVVQSAAKGVTTVQEAPVIVTVVPGDEIRDRQLVDLEGVIDTVPGWMRADLLNEQYANALVRGQGQAVQLLHDGLSLFDPFVNIATMSRVQPVETIKRIEMITGPGGVLWGANSLVGILNLITKDADDVDGLEIGGALGGGNGDQSVARAYVMYGDPELAQGAAKLFVHASFETYEGPAYQRASMLILSPEPQPDGPILAGPVATADPPRSYIVDLDGKLTVGAWQVRVQLPMVDRHFPVGFAGYVVRKGLGEVTGDSHQDFADRYVVAEHRARVADGRAGFTIKAYGIQFVRRLEHLQVLGSVPALLDGGLSFETDLDSYRVGAAIDADVELPRDARVLYGAEAFNELTINDTTASRQGPGTEATFIGPEQLERLPTPCPRTLDRATGTISFVAGCPLTFAFPASRTVLGAYVNPRWQPWRDLILDLGARAQIAPAALGLQRYDATITTSGTAVYGFRPGWHLKVNFAQGFRPPVFNNVASNGEAIQLDGRPDLRVETSEAEQVELNARIFKGERRIRELDARADCSYTTLHNFIQVVGGRYENTADRGIHSAELLAKLYLAGGHRLELGYTWLRVDTADFGVVKSLPENWFHLTGVFSLVDGTLSATTDLRVVGTMEDPDRFIEYRDDGYDAAGRVVNVKTNLSATIGAGPSELVMDRLPPQADLEVGLTWTPSRRTHVRATVFNALDGRYDNPDHFGEYQARDAMQPMPREGFRAYLQASYQY